MDDFDAAVAAVSALPVLVRGSMSRLQAAIPAAMDPTEPEPHTFTIGGMAGRDHGIAVHVRARRPDDRAVLWNVEVWVHPTGTGVWSINVKAEIDLDDRDGDDWCVVNEQQIIATLAELPAAIARAAELVADHPRGELLTADWEPAEWADRDLIP